MYKFKLQLLIIILIFLNSIALYSIPDKCQNCPEHSCKAKQQTEVKANNTNKDDEFEKFTPADSSDEFQSTDEFEKSSKDSAMEKTNSMEASLLQNPIFVKTIIIFLITILAGILVRFQWGRNLRAIFLIGMIVWLGFISGACPCMISSLSFLILLPLGIHISWVSLLWFLGLLPLTYFFGRIWCGWVCHLGALQEFLHIPIKKAFFRSNKAQKVFKIIQIICLIGLITQLILTKTYLWAEIDPFKVAYNLYSSNLIGYILLGILILSSLFIYRPFCKAVCPVGLILSWIALIPGASILTIKSECNGCGSCDKSCKYDAITKDNNSLIIDNKECIRCGDCMNTCKKEGFLFGYNRTNQDKITFFKK